MNQCSHRTDEDLEDSLFGSPPPSPTRGRSPSQEIFISGDQVGPVIAVPSTGVARKNVGTIALPGSHMSCAELPANLPASSLSFPRPTSSHPSPSTTPLVFAGASTHTPVVTSRSSSRSVSSRTSSATCTTTSASTVASSRRRRTPKAKSLTPAPAPAPPPISLPGPNEPTPPNFLRSQSSLLGLAGLVGCVKPAQLYTHAPQHTSVRQSLIRGSTPTNPIVLDDDQDAPHIEELPSPQPHVLHSLDQLDPELLRSNILNSLIQEKNIFPVLESLIKLLGGEPHFPSSPPPQLFSRPYGHDIVNVQSPRVSATAGSTTIVPPQKRRKLKHVPAGAVDWDIPFPFATGEGPEGYRYTWARDRAVHLVTQLLELIQGATKRAAIKTAKSRGTSSKRRTRAQSHWSSRSASVESQIRQVGSTRADTNESLLHASSNLESAASGTPSNVTPVDSLSDFLGSLESPSTVEEGSLAVSCDYSAFEEWLSQLQQFIPLETNAPTPESDCDACSPVPLDSSAPGLAPNASAQCEADKDSHAIRDEAIDPTLLAISQLGGSAPQSQSPTSPAPTLAPSNFAPVLDTSTPTTLTHSARTSSSSLTELLTPPSEVSADALTSTIAHQDLDCGTYFHPLITRVWAYKSYF